jgi:mono/diheme cytochrome c family protein
MGGYPMKTLILLLGTIVLITFAGAVSGEAVIKQEPLKYHDVRTTDGGVLYDTLCASCHGATGKGDGPVAPALVKPVSDLTVLSANNGGVYPRESVEESIYGDSRVLAHRTIDMPLWGDQLMSLRPDWRSLQRKAFTKERIRNLAVHVEGMQDQ